MLVESIVEKWEKLVTSIFALSCNVLYSSQNKFQFFSQILSSANVFNLEWSEILLCGKDLWVFKFNPLTHSAAFWHTKDL